MQLEQDEKGPFLSDETPACDKNRQPPPPPRKLRPVISNAQSLSPVGKAASHLVTRR